MAAIECKAVIQSIGIPIIRQAANGQKRTLGSGPKFDRLGLGDLLSGIDERHLHNLRGGLSVRRFHVDLVAEFSQLDPQPRVPDVFLQPG